MIAVSNADRVVFPEVGRTKGDVVAYYERIAPRALPHLVDRPLSIKRYPKGLAAAGFFQKNVPAHYPESIRRFEVPRSAEAAKRHPRKGKSEAEHGDVTIYPLLSDGEHLAYLANQGAIELHVPTSRVPALDFPDRIVFDLDPPLGATALVRRAALSVRDALAEYGLDSVPIATGSKGYHVVAAITPTEDFDAITTASQQMAALLAAKHETELTTAFRIVQRAKRVFVDWLRNRPSATVVAPYSLRARPRATVATPLAWEEIEVVDPDAFTMADVDRLLDRPDTLSELAEAPSDAGAFVAAVGRDFDASGLVLERFDRFRS